MLIATRPRLLLSVARDPMAMAAGLIVLTLVTVALTAQWVAPFEPNNGDLGRAFAAPGPTNLLGTDSQGRDILSRLIHGLRLTFLVSLTSVVLGGTVGAAIGLIAAFYRQWDGVLMRLIDVLLSFPEILVALVLATLIGPGLTSTVLAVSLATVPGTARIARSAALVVMSLDYMEAGRAIGLRQGRLIFRYLLPNCFSSIGTIMTLRIGQAILIMSSLSFLGLGAQPPTAELGNMASQGLQFFFIAPHLAIVPSLLIMLLVLAFNVLGDALRDVLDPRFNR